MWTKIREYFWGYGRATELMSELLSLIGRRDPSQDDHIRAQLERLESLNNESLKERALVLRQAFIAHRLNLPEGTSVLAALRQAISFPGDKARTEVARIYSESGVATAIYQACTKLVPNEGDPSKHDMALYRSLAIDLGPLAAQSGGAMDTQVKLCSVIENLSLNRVERTIARFNHDRANAFANAEPKSSTEGDVMRDLRWLTYVRPLQNAIEDIMLARQLVGQRVLNARRSRSYELKNIISLAKNVELELSQLTDRPHP